MSLYFYEDFFLGIKSLALIREREWGKKRRKSLSSYLSNFDYSLYLIQWYLDYKSSRKQLRVVSSPMLLYTLASI